jgi:hypothetical protein
MCKKTLLTLTVLALASVTAFAASKDGVVVSQDGRMTIATKPVHSAATRTPSDDAGLVKIVDNLGAAYPKGEYWCCEGATIFGPTAASGAPEFWEAAAFTPTADHTVAKIEVAVGFVEGTNGVVLTINKDASGVPGTVIKSFQLSGLPTFGSCCTIEKVSLSAGIPVKANTQYWIVLKTNAKESNTWAAWNVNDTDQVDPAPTAFWCSDDKGGQCSVNDKWVAGESQPGLAFAVLGSN